VSITSTQACISRTADLDEKRAQLRAQKPPIAGQAAEEVLMAQGRIPGWNLVLIKREAEARLAKGFTQDQVITDLKLLGLLLADGTPAPDDIRANPCDSQKKDTIIPAGQPIISFELDGQTTATAWFCKPVVPSVAVIDRDGARHDVATADLPAYNTLFTSVAGSCPIPGWFLSGSSPVLGAAGGLPPGYRVDRWTVDGVDKPATPLTLRITPEGAPSKVAATLRVDCRQLTVDARFGWFADPKPNCPFADPARNLYAVGSKITVSADQSNDYIWQGWKETGTAFNPVLATMDRDVTLTGQFRAKTAGEQIQSKVIDPAVTALAVGAKKVVGGIALSIKVLADTVINGLVLKGISLIGTALQSGFAAMGVEGQVLDGIVVGLQTPSTVLGASMKGFDCIEQWAWGSSVPTLGDMKGMAMSAVSNTARQDLAGVDGAALLRDARAFAQKLEARDPDTVAKATAFGASGGVGQPVVALALDIQKHPEVWANRAQVTGEFALERLRASIKQDDFTWESSASDAWTSGGDELATCMAANGRAMAGQ
jgi:hypothetical protein